MKTSVIAIVAVAVVAVVAIGGWLVLRGDDEASARGTCDTATYQLTAEEDDEGLEVAFELQSSAPGETWTLVVEQGGTSLLTGERQTDEDGELDADVIADESGSDEFTVTATQSPDGAPCVATLTR